MRPAIRCVPHDWESHKRGIAGNAVETETSVSASVLNTIYRTKVDYAELKVLVLGLFSRKPNNLLRAITQSFAEIS